MKAIAQNKIAVNPRAVRDANPYNHTTQTELVGDDVLGVPIKMFTFIIH